MSKRKSSSQTSTESLTKRVKYTLSADKDSFVNYEQIDMYEQEFTSSQEQTTMWSSPQIESQSKNSKTPTKHHKRSDLEVEQLVSEEENRIQSLSNTTLEENRQLYAYFNDLQVIAAEHRLNFKVPELVVVGMQSDGKSSFVEALLGFQFNTVETQIGTRRPLILQMMNDPKCETPQCYFYHEDLELGMESKPTPVEQIESELRKRTDNLCGKDNVRSKPILLRVYYKNCANLTVYDTPGFRKGEKDPLAEKITKMVMNLIKPKHRIIVCLEQSTVEWCNTQVRPIVKQVDPKFERTILITTKFNNRINQFKHKKEVDDYLSSASDPDAKNANVFFISLPSGRGARDLTEEEFKEKIKEVYLEDYRNLLYLNFDEKYKKYIGIYNVKNFLEQKLNEKYRECLQPLIEKLEMLQHRNEQILNIIRSEIEKINSADMNRIAANLINEYIRGMNAILKGTTLFGTQEHGMTLEDERKASGFEQWPNYNLDFPIRNAKYKLYGGAQLERLLAEFEVVAHSQEFPQTTDDEVAVTIGLNSVHTTPDYDRGASDLAQKKSKTIFTPLIDILLQRSRFIMTRSFKIVTSYLQSQQKPEGKYSAFFNELQKASEIFIDQVLQDIREKTYDEFDTFTKIMDWDLMGSFDQKLDYDLLSPSKEDTLKRIQEITKENPEKYKTFENDRSRELTPERCQKIKIASAKLFASVRLLFVKYIRCKYNAFFINPIFTNLDNFIRYHFSSMGEDKLQELMGYDVIKLKKQEAKLVKQLEHLKEQTSKFKEFEMKFIKKAL